MRGLCVGGHMAISFFDDFTEFRENSVPPYILKKYVHYFNFFEFFKIFFKTLGRPPEPGDYPSSLCTFTLKEGEVIVGIQGEHCRK